MTDTTAKPMWRRHKGACNQRIFNDPIDWEGHLRNCPYDIRHDLDKALEQLDKLKSLDDRLAALETAEPATDPYAVEDDLDPDDQRSQYIDELDDDDLDEPTTDTGNIRTFRPNDYFTGPGGGAA